MKIKNLILLLLIFSINSVAFSENTEEANHSSNEVYLPNDYFSSSSSSQDDYQEESTTEGPDGPPAPIDDWAPVLFLLGVALVGKQYLRAEKRV